VSKKLLSYIQSYGNDIDEVTLEKFGADPFVIAHAIILNSCVVTREISNNATAALNKKISSICILLNVQFYIFSRFMWEVRKIMP
jgi:hypothetical protein